MANAICRLLAIPCILLVLLLVGAPEPMPANGAIMQSAQAAAAAITPGTSGTSTDVRRPEAAPRSALMPFYVSLATLEALDVHTTMSALDRGATEANPVMSGLVQNKAAFVAVKAGTAAGAIYLADRLRTRSRVGAFLLMSGFNSLYAMAVANNYRVLHGLDR